jgi:carboxyl-terminal processing protease
MKRHYSPACYIDEFSKGIYKEVQALDPSKRFFCNRILMIFSKYELQLDDQIINKDLTFFNLDLRLIDEEWKKVKAFIQMC